METQALRALLGERLEIVQEIARLNARQLQNRQILSGCELEVMLCERDLSQGGNEPGRADRLEQARAQCVTAQARLAEDDAELLGWHRRLDAMDQRISES